MILFESEKVKLEYDASVPCIIWKPDGSPMGEDFRQPFVIGIDYVIKNIKKIPNLGWLNDGRELKTTRKEDLDWLDTTANVKAYEVGLKKVAFVLPNNVFGKMGMRLYVHNTMKRPDNKLEIKAFNKIEDARNWLQGDTHAIVDEVRLSINQQVSTVIKNNTPD